MSLAADPAPVQLQLVTPTGAAIVISEAIAARPMMTRTMTGVSTIDFSVADAERKIMRAPELRQPMGAIAGGLHWELARISKVGDRVTFTFEDAIVAELRRQTKRLSIGAGTTTRAGVTKLFAREAEVPYAVDPTYGRKLNAAVERSTSGEPSNSWEILGSDIADPVNGRRFTDGRTLIMGSDQWLLGRYAHTMLYEHAGAVGSIDFDLDTGRRAETASIDIDLTDASLDPGMPIGLPAAGPATGTWLLEEIRQELGSPRGTLKLTRGRRALPEPPPEADGGVTGFVDRPSSSTAAAAPTGAGASKTPAARERMVQYALSKAGGPYVWGGNGPRGFDCSGLVQEATRAAGRVLNKTAANQWATVGRSGRRISVDEAIRTRGALLFKIGVSKTNHVAISLGDGTTIEAVGRLFGIRIMRNASSRTWTGGGLWL